MHSLSIHRLIVPVVVMTLVVVASNILVQYPFELFGLGDYLTWGAFTYPVAFLVTDLTNRRHGPRVARQLVVVGFALAVVLSIWLATPRIAMASGTAFLVGQLLDITLFNRLRRQAWWRAPFVSTVIGSVLDTALFFSLAFAGDPDMSGLVNLFGTDVMFWQSLVVFDFTVKMLIALIALLPYGALMSVILPMERAEKAVA
ncbi:MAG: queuosine precursor transporter [Alphaproteobacteria bacterium]|nr:queuosine precursor transporter [Alphaproteobacteria bacterium]